jgi:HAMP domain-containing protein
MDDLVHTELLCMNAFIGLTRYGEHTTEPPREDDFATNGQIGIAQFPRSALKPLEAQGRGFTHGHEKIISMPRTRAARLKQLFTAAATEHGEDELTRWCQQARDAVLQAACTLQYDSAVLPGIQLGVTLRPEPFSSRQQHRSRLDGQVEEADDNAPLRPLIPVTERELNGHLTIEEEKAITEQRPMRHPYKELPLTGATQSMMPMYRRSNSFGQIEIPDEFGYYLGDATEHANNGGWLPYAREYVVEPSGEVTGFRMPNGENATTEQIKDDCEAWKTSFARDQRACFIQNHDHDCTGICNKYEKKRNATELPQRCGKKITWPGVPKCRFRFFRYIALSIAGFVKYVIRRGKELVENAFIATGNEENEYGKAVVPRGSPFRSSSQDVLQATIQCNADYQYQQRAVPEQELSATEQEQSTDSYKSTASFSCGCSMLKQRTGKLIMATLATAMRAANVADFYMTKYLSKAQEALGPVTQPFIAGMPRISAAENVPEATETTVVQRAKQRICRFIFCANRTMWFSACELGVFLTTGANCVKTETTTKVFSGKGIAMMHECKRLLNHSIAEQGLLFAHHSTQRTEATAMHTFLVPKPADTEADTDRDAAEHSDSDAASNEHRDATEHVHGDRSNTTTEPPTKKQRRQPIVADVTEHPDNDPASNEHGDATEHAHDDPSNTTTKPPTKKQRRQPIVASDAPQGDATEHAAYPENDCDEAFPQVITSAGSHATVVNATGTTQMFTKSVAHRDDWLHRGIALRDMDYYHYARYIERVELPRSGDAQGFQKRHGVYYLFDSHYALAKSYVRVLLKRPKTMQTSGRNANDQTLIGGRTTPYIKHTSIRAPIARESRNVKTP